MTDLFIKAITVVHPGSPHHLKKCDVIISNGELKDIQSAGILEYSNVDQRIIDGGGSFLAPSFVDCSFWQGEPGNERIEDLESSAELAAFSGFGHLMMMPDVNPPIQSNVDVQFFKDRSAHLGINFIPVARVTRAEKPENSLTEIMHLADQGVGAFSNAQYAISDLNLFSRALQYCSMTSKLFLNHPVQRELVNGGVVHDGAVAEQMGLSGVLPQAEYLALGNQIELSNYYNIPFFAMNISSGQSVRLIKNNKNNRKKTSPVYASVPLLNLFYTVKDQKDFDTNKKLWPVLRDESDRKALVKGLKEGVIDLVGSNHFPVPEEEKNVEFNYAPFGAISLQLVFPILLKVLGAQSSIAEVVEILSLRPREIFSIKTPKLEIGEEADYCILSEEEWVFDDASNLSKSSNSSLLGQKWKGRCKGLIKKKKYWLDEAMG